MVRLSSAASITRYKVSGMDWNDCPESNGIGVRNAPEYAGEKDHEMKLPAPALAEAPALRKASGGRASRRQAQAGASG